MTEEGPELEVLLHRLTDCPAEFLQLALGKETAGADAVAIVCDHIRALSPEAPPELSAYLPEIRSASPAKKKLLAIVCWLLHDEWFLARPHLEPATWQLLVSQSLGKLSSLVKPEAFVHDADRREELARLCLFVLDLRPLGETVEMADDRLTALDSVERDKVLRATAAAERRAREVREAMARAQAEEAASRYGE